MRRVVALAAVLVAGPACGEEPSRWTAAAFVKAALAASPELDQARLSLEAAEARTKADFADAALPTFSASVNAYPWGDNPANGYQFNSWRLNRRDVGVNAGLNWNLFNSFADYLKIKSSSLSRDIARRDFDSARQEHALRALRAYFGLMLQSKLLEVQREAFKAQQAQYELTQDLYKHGMKSLTDMLKTETDLRGAELSLESAEADRRLALFRFNTLLGKEPRVEAVLTEALTGPATGVPPLEVDTRRALIDRPEMVKTRLEADRARTAWQQSLRSNLPALTLGYQWNYTESATFGLPVTAFGGKNPSHYLALTLALPSGLNLVSQTQSIRASRADLFRSRKAEEAQVRRIREEVFSAHNELTRALRSYQVATRKQDISKRNLDLVMEQYRLGNADVIKLSQARVDYVNSQVERMRAFNDSNINRAEYRRALGEPLWQ